ncbi:MAG: hypothetical protein JWM97_856 [Phycisphaerales bacterium]|nr:hypothetical protein [Phycisphaerales bacterium]MDB5303307.1 hypothetical protein [Phycisphaerales bacterium]
MSDATRTVESIRAFLASGAGGGADMAGVAGDYVALCREANARLLRCADFLREGLRGEALQFAGCRPRLADFVATLDFPEVGSWDHACDSMGWPRPVRLITQAARDLGLAAAQHEPLRDLLARHRFLALSRAPLPARLTALRELASADPGNPIWKGDAAMLEAARFAELRTEIAAALKSGDGEWVEKLLAEVNAGPWHAPVPPDLTDALSRASAALREARLSAVLGALVPRVRAAYAAMSHDECRQVFAEWGRAVKEAKLPVPAELRQEIMPLARWLDEQDERRQRERHFRNACADLAGAIEADADGDALRAQYRAVVGYEMEIPPELAAAYRRRIDAWQREQRGEKRKQFALAAALVLGVVLALGALAYVMFASGKR